MIYKSSVKPFAPRDKAVRSYHRKTFYDLNPLYGNAVQYGSIPLPNLFPPPQSSPPKSFNSSTWMNHQNELLDRLVEGGPYFDHPFQIQSLIEDGWMGVDSQDLVNKPPFVKYDFEYNFFIRGYESGITAPTPRHSISETLLPNLYVLASEVQNENLDGTLGIDGATPAAPLVPFGLNIPGRSRTITTDAATLGSLVGKPGTLYAKQLTLNGRFKNIFVDIVSDKTGKKIGEEDSGQYFDSYVQAISNPPISAPLPADLVSVQNQYKNVVFPLHGIRLLKDYNSRKHLFPMYSEISFETDSFTEISQILAESSLGAELIKHIILTPGIESSMVSDNRLLGVGSSRPQAGYQDEMVPSWDITNWMKSLQSDSTPPLEIGNANMIFMGGHDVEIEIATNPKYKLLKTLMSTLFYAKLLQITKNHLRSFEEIFNGDFASSETVFYEIKKYEGTDAVEENAIQSFYFVNSNEIDVLNFVDTQVKYNKQYTYVIYGYQLVLGNQYRYMNREEMQGVRISSKQSQFCVENNASFKLFKVPLNKTTNRVLDRPPVFPDVDIVPYRGVNNKVLFNINSNVGFYELDPISISDGDEPLINALRESQKKPRGPLEYKTDDKTVLFEVYRIERHPATYRDFANNKIASVETAFRKDRNYFLPGASFVDNVVPNRVYYYTFRTIDNHGHASNPSPIYQFKIVDNSGAVYPLIEVVELKPPGFGTKVSTKPMRKYVQILPSLPQTLLDEEELFAGQEERNSPRVYEAFDSLPLGVQNDKVWNQKYKVRFVSKKTGRKFDLNLEFKHRGDLEGETPP